MKQIKLVVSPGSIAAGHKLERFAAENNCVARPAPFIRDDVRLWEVTGSPRNVVALMLDVYAIVCDDLFDLEEPEAGEVETVFNEIFG